MSNLSERWSKLTVYASILFLAVTIYTSGYWTDKGRVIASDVIDYYGYLPATFIFKDLGVDKAETIEGGTFYTFRLPNGNNIFKMTMGMAMVYLPFFIVGHITAHLLDYPLDGFSDPYRLALLIGGLLYYSLGLLFLRKILLRTFSDKLTAITLVTIGLGTNLFYYASDEGTMSHVYNFALITIFLWHTIRWHEEPSPLRLLFLGILGGWITLIRPSNIIILLIFFLYGIWSWSTLKVKVTDIFGKFNWFLLMFLGFLIPWIPQFMYNLYFTDHLFFYSYNDEGFFFNNPQIINGLFSYRKGWLTYTPLMVFALAGIPFLFRNHKELAWPVLIYTILNIYIIFSWWCWWYGGSFGQRPMIDSYGLLAIPMAYLFRWVLSGQKLKIFGFATVIFLLIGLNQFQIRKYRKGSIHFADMTGKAYWHSFTSIRPKPGFYELLETPDYNKAKQGIYVVLPKEDLPD